MLTGLVPRLVDILKSGVGLGTKVCGLNVMDLCTYPTIRLALKDIV